MDNETISTRAALTFKTAYGDRISISIPRANPAISEETAQIAMEGIIDTEAVMTATGRPYSIKSANVISTERVRLV